MHLPAKTYLARTLILLGLVFGASVRPVGAQIAKLEHPDTTAGNFFGVAVSVDGDRAIIGASAENACGVNSGAAYVFHWNDRERRWAEEARLVPEDCDAGRFFGRAVSISGNRVLIGS